MSAREKLEGYSMQPELLIDGEFPMLRVSHELGRIADEIEGDEARAKSFKREVAFWWPLTVALAIAARPWQSRRVCSSGTASEHKRS